MKISSGKFKGRKLLDNPYDHIRPTADIVKQAIFNKLFEKVREGTVLDLFCGTGALGIEALSRGAKEVVFADKDKRSINLTIKNLQSLGLDAVVLNYDYEKTLKSLQGKKFDIIILDPPYMGGLYEKTLNLIFEYDLLSDDGIIVCEHEKDVKIDTSPFELIDEKRYGIRMLSYLKNKS